MSTHICKQVGIFPLRLEHWDRVAEIYAEGIATGNATFETSVPTWEQWDAAHRSFGRLVAMVDTEVAGWAALTPISKRAAYAGVADVSVYVAANFRGRGCGKLLLEALIKDAEEHNVWTLQASIFPENEASLALHRKCGFEDVGRRKRIAKLNHLWRDTILLERRSALVGLD